MMKSKITKALALAAAVFGLQAFTNTAWATIPSYGYNTSIADGSFTSSNYLPKNSTVKVFDGITLNDIKTGNFSARFGGESVGIKLDSTVIKVSRTLVAAGYHVTETADGLTVQFQVLDSSYVKCAKVLFSNGTGGVYAKVLTNSYKSGGSLGDDADQYTSTSTPYGSDSTSGAYGIAAISVGPSLKYQNKLAGSVVLPADTYGSITVGGDGIQATSFASGTVLGSSGTGISGSYSSLIITGVNYDSHTVAGWFKVDSLPSNGNKQVWGAANGDGNLRGYAIVVDSAGKIGVNQANSASTGTSITFTGTNYFSTETVIAANTWYHLAISIVRDGERKATVRLFVNGVDKGLISKNQAGTGCNGGASCTYFSIGAGISAAGLYIDNGALVNTDLIKSIATNEDYVVPYVAPTVFTATIETDYTGTLYDLDWKPTKPSTFPATAELIITNKAVATVTIDSALNVSIIKVVSAADKTLALNKGQDVSVTIADKYDFSEAAGAVTVNYATDAATVAAGSDTVLTSVNNPTLTIDANKKLTVKGGTVQETTTTIASGGTLNFDGGTAAAPVTYEANGGNGSSPGKLTIASGAYLKLRANNNKVFDVTGAGAAVSTNEICKASGGLGMSAGTQFRNVTLVPTGFSGNNYFWVEQTGSMDATVNLDVRSQVKLNNNYSPTMGSLFGSGAIVIQDGSSSSTVTIKPSMDATYSGTSSAPFVIDASDYTQTLSGAYTGALTVNAGGKVKLTGSAQPSSTTSAGYVEVAAGKLTHDVTLNASTAVLNVTTNTPGEASYSITSGTFSQGEGTVQLNGATLPNADYEVSGNRIVKKGESPYAKFDYGIVYSWLTTGSSVVCMSSGDSSYQVFDIVGGTNKTDTTYHGNTTFKDQPFWKQFAYATGISTTYAAPGEILRLAQGSYLTSIGATWGPLTFGGIIAEAGDTGYTFVNKSDGNRSNLLGDPSNTTPTFFDIGANVAFDRTGKLYLSGTLTFDIASGKTFNLNSGKTAQDLALFATVEAAGSGAFGTTTAGGTLIMKGEGTLQVYNLKALGSTLDYSNIPLARETAYISGTLTINDSTVIKLPAELPENTAFKMATALSGANDGVRTIWLGETQVTKNVTFANGAISYSTTIEYKTLGWDAEQSAWTNAAGVATAVDNTCILNAKAGDVITFASAVTPHQFNMPESGTVTLGTGGNLMNYAITVPSGATLALGWNSSDAYSQVISGAGAVDVTGAMVQLSANNTFTGTLTVQNGGYLKMGANNCLNNSNTATVNAGGTLDINGKKELGALSFTLNGGALVNNGSNITHGEQQMASITLTANSTVGGTGNFGLVTANYNTTTLTLNGHTLTKTGSGTFWLCNTTIGGTGTLAIQDGTVDAHNDRTCTFADGTLLLISGGTFAANAGKAVTIPTLTVTSGTISGSGSISGLTTLKGSVDFSTFTGTITLANEVSIGTEGADETVTLGNASTEGKTLNVAGGTLNLMKDGVTRQVGALSLADGSMLMVSTNTTAAAVQVNGAVNLEGKNVAVAGVLPESGAKVYLLGATSITGTGTLVNPGAWTVALENNTLTATKKPSTYITPGEGGDVSHATDVTDSLDINRELAIEVTKGTDIEVKSDSPAETVVEAMNQTGANGYKVWESAVLGLSPTNAASQLVISPIQGSSTTTVTLQVPTVNVDKTTGADVTFCFWSKDGEGTWTEVPGGAVESGEQKELDLPEDGVRYYQLRTTITTQAQKIPTVIPSADIVASGMPLTTGTGSTKTCASLGTKTLDAAAESLDVGLTGSGVFEGQEYHLEVTEGASNSSSHFAIVAKATTNTTKHVTFYFGKTIPAGSTCKLTLIEAAGNGNVAVKSDEGFEGIDPINANVIVSTRVGWLPYEDELATVASPTLLQQYRIPAIASDGKGEVIACYDVRYGKSDLGLYWSANGYSGIDCGENYSSDSGKTFGPVHLAVDVPNFRDGDNNLIGGPGTGSTASYMNKTNDIGDVCVLYDPNGDEGKGLYWMMGFTGGGLMSAGTDSCNNDVVLYTRKPGKDSPWVEWDNGGEGDHWAKRSVKWQILTSLGVEKGSSGWGFLEGPGHGIVTTKACTIKGENVPAGTLVFPIQTFFSGSAGSTEACAAYSTNGGTTWKTTALTTDKNSGSPQENCVMELDDGTWYMCTKCQPGNEYRCYIYDHEKDKWTRVDGAPCPTAKEGSCLRMGVGSDGKGRYAICHARNERRNIVVYFGVDTTSSSDPTEKAKGISWDWNNYITLHKEETNGGYSSMCMVDDTTLGILYETAYGASTDGGCDTSGCRMYFTRIDVSDKVVGPTSEK